MSDGHETRIRQLEVEQGRTALALEHINGTLEKLVEKVDDINTTIQQGKGALAGSRWALGIAAAAIGGIASWVTTHFYRNP